jgi:hypothetical protein
MNYKEAIKYLQQDEGHRVKCDLGVFEIVEDRRCNHIIIYCNDMEFDLISNAPEIVSQYFEVVE